VGSIYAKRQGRARKSAEESNKNDQRFQSIDMRRETRQMRDDKIGQKKMQRRFNRDVKTGDDR